MDERRSALEKDDGFAEFYKNNFERIYKYVYRIFPNKQIAEDIAQETFYTAYLKYGEFRGHPNPQLWLLRIARYKILECRKSMRYRRAEPLEQECPELAKEDVHYSVKELEVSALTMLGEKGWRLIKRRYLFGSTISEMAEAEGITENNMRVRLSRLRSRLKNGLED